MPDSCSAHKKHTKARDDKKISSIMKIPDASSAVTQTKKRSTTSHTKRFKELWGRILSFKDYEKVSRAKKIKNIDNLGWNALFPLSSLRLARFLRRFLRAERFCFSFSFASFSPSIMQCGLIYGEMILLVCRFVEINNSLRSFSWKRRKRNEIF